MHADSTFIDHIVFMFFASVFLVVFALGSMVVHFLVRGRGCR
jgi:hypothetical protein